MEKSKAAREQLEGYVVMENLHLKDGRGAKEVLEGDVAEKMFLEEERGTGELPEMDEQDKLLIKKDRTVNEQVNETEKKNLSMKETRGTKEEEPEGEREMVLLEDRGNNENSKGKEMLLEESRGVKDQPDGEVKEHLHIEVIRKQLIHGEIIEPLVKKGVEDRSFLNGNNRAKEFLKETDILV